MEEEYRKPRESHVTPGGLRTGNKREFDVAKRLEDEGWEVLKRGWPDFLAYKDGKVRLVEVKPAYTRDRSRGRGKGMAWKLKPHQKRMVAILEEVFGVEVEVVTGPKGL